MVDARRKIGEKSAWLGMKGEGIKEDLYSGGEDTASTGEENT